MVVVNCVSVTVIQNYVNVEVFCCVLMVYNVSSSNDNLSYLFLNNIQVLIEDVLKKPLQS